MPRQSHSMFGFYALCIILDDRLRHRLRNYRRISRHSCWHEGWCSNLARRLWL